MVSVIQDTAHMLARVEWITVLKRKNNRKLKEKLKLLELNI